MKHLRMMGVLLVLMGLLAACEDEPEEPRFIILPTQVMLPSMTPLPSPTDLPRTATPNITTVPTPTSTLELTETPSMTPVPLVEVVIAVQHIPAGYAIPPEAVQTLLYPEPSVPFTGIASVEAAVNMVAVVDIPCFQPIIESELAVREVGTDFQPLGSCGAVPVLEFPVMFVNVAITTAFIPAGTQIRPSMIALRPVPKGFEPAGYMDSLAELVGSTALQDLLREQPIQAGMVQENTDS